MGFKLGDRVRWPHDGEEGTVRGEGSEGLIDVEWDDEGLVEVNTEDLELVEDQPNRTYYGGATPPNAEERARVRSLLEEKTENPFEQNVRRILTDVGDIITAKNISYGDSALNPIRVFSKADRMEQLFVRLDDKLSRVQRGSEYPGDDTLRDIIGYCTLILVAQESN